MKEGWRDGVKVAVEAGFNQRAVMGSEAVCVCVCLSVCLCVLLCSWLCGRPTGCWSHCAQLCVSCI